MNILKVFFMLVGFSFIQCTQERPNAAKHIHTDTNAAMIRDRNWDMLNSMPLEDALHQFGKPLLSENFDMSKGLNEFRIGLYNVIRKEEYRGKPLLIQELTWESDSLHYKTVWYRSVNKIWLPVDVLVWQKDVQF